MDVEKILTRETSPTLASLQPCGELYRPGGYKRHRRVRYDFGEEFDDCSEASTLTGITLDFFAASSLQISAYTMWLTKTLCVPPFDS
jgi:hypothetical protein